jgi:endonuclease YncB( thermonuclease family)
MIRRLGVLAFGLALSLASTAHADAVISGPACVIDGNSIQIGGKVRKGECWGGINVRLHGSNAPKPGEICKGRMSRKYACGDEAKKELANMIRLHEISCYHLDGEFDGKLPVVTCLSGRLDLAREMVLRGLAKATGDKATRYNLEERDAKKSRRGIWQ